MHVRPADGGIMEGEAAESTSVPLLSSGSSPLLEAQKKELPNVFRDSVKELPHKNVRKTRITK